jgi:hypothetical protein
MTNQGNTPNKVPVEQWLAIRREEALRIDVETAEVTWTYAQTFDPYGVEGVPEELKTNWARILRPLARGRRVGMV